MSSSEKPPPRTEPRDAFRRYFEDAITNCDLDLVDELVDPLVVSHSRLSGAQSGVENFKALMRREHAAIPDFRLSVHEVICEADIAVALVTARGTQQSELFGVSPTGDEFVIEEIEIARFRHGRIVELWSVQDTWPLALQLLSRDVGRIATRPWHLATDERTAGATSVAESRAVFERFYAQVIDKGDLSALQDILDPAAVHHSPFPGMSPDAEGLRQTILGEQRAFADLTMKAELIVAEGDMVAGRFVTTGTHIAEFAGIAPTHHAIAVEQMMMVRLRDGRISELWRVVDALALLQQLGALPQPDDPASSR